MKKLNRRQFVRLFFTGAAAAVAAIAVLPTKEAKADSVRRSCRRTARRTARRTSRRND